MKSLDASPLARSGIISLMLFVAACASPTQSPPPSATAVLVASPAPTRAETIASKETRAPFPLQSLPFNPFANLTAEQQACLKKAWGEEAFNAITTFKRPPEGPEQIVLSQCNIPPPPGAAGMQPGQTPGAPISPPSQPPRTGQPGASPIASGTRECLPKTRVIAIPDSDGPSFHQVLLARSSDGLNWQTDGKVLIDQASVPEGVRFADGRSAIYAVDGSGQGGPGHVYAESRDEGKTWTCGKVNFVGLGADPDIVLLADGRMRMYSIMFPFGPGQQPPAPGQSTKPNSVNSAISSDGKSWTVEEGARIEGANYTDPDVVRVGNEWYMYISTGPLAWAAKSSDGLKFETIGRVNDTGAVSGSYVFPDGKIRHYFCGNSGIESALSDAGGSVWKKEAGTRIAKTAAMKSICDPSVLSDGKGGYLMIYKIQPK